jgi:hypothetical protein
MKKWLTYIKAVNPQNGELCLWVGPLAIGETIQDAQKWCNNNGFGYCQVVGEFVAEIDYNLAYFASTLLDSSINN